MIPAMFLQAVDWCDVVGGHPTLAVLRPYLTPLSILVVAQHTQLLTWTQEVEQCSEWWHNSLVAIVLPVKLIGI